MDPLSLQELSPGPNIGFEGKMRCEQCCTSGLSSFGGLQRLMAFERGPYLSIFKLRDKKKGFRFFFFS